MCQRAVPPGMINILAALARHRVGTGQRRPTMGAVHTVFAQWGTASVHGFPALLTLYEKQMTPWVSTVGMRIGGCVALMASTDDIAGYAFAQPFIKNKILADKLRRQVLLLHFMRIADDAAV